MGIILPSRFSPRHTPVRRPRERDAPGRKVTAAEGVDPGESMLGKSDQWPKSQIGAEESSGTLGGRRPQLDSGFSEDAPVLARGDADVASPYPAALGVC